MALLPLLNGAYVARSGIASYQRCVNLYPEKNPEGAPFPFTHYLTPGLTKLADGPLVGAWRGLYQATNDLMYGVLGSNLYEIDSGWNFTLKGTIEDRLTPVSMVDNGAVLVLVDGTSKGYSYTFATSTFARITDANFLGADFVYYLDTFFVFNQPGTRSFYSSLSNELKFDPLYIASKVGSTDMLMAIIVNHVDLWLIGRRTTEVWSNVGAPAFPFQRMPGIFIQHGTVAPHSVAAYNLQIMWLSQDNNGQCIVVEASGYEVKNVSTPALVHAIASYEKIDDAIAFVYQQEDHAFYVLNFPSASRTWVRDLSNGLWHERTYTDPNGLELRHRANCCSFSYGMNVVGDFQNGKLYKFDLENPTDDGDPIVRRRGFPNVVAEGRMIHHRRFIADIETGLAESST